MPAVTITKTYTLIAETLVDIDTLPEGGDPEDHPEVKATMELPAIDVDREPGGVGILSPWDFVSFDETSVEANEL